jgi:hypothetical protein
MELKQSRENRCAVEGHLLIVPYGIETWTEQFTVTFIGLLIVPYGIETDESI